LFIFYDNHHHLQQFAKKLNYITDSKSIMIINNNTHNKSRLKFSCSTMILLRGTASFIPSTMIFYKLSNVFPLNRSFSNTRVCSYFFIHYLSSNLNYYYFVYISLIVLVLSHWHKLHPINYSN
jgi:hypothetical protein